MKNILKIAFMVVAIILVIDALGFCAWVLSGQFPSDNVYVGSLTAHAIGALTR